MSHRPRGPRPTRRPSAFRPLAEALEGRSLLTASLQPIGPQTAPSQQGLAVPLNGSGTTDPQTFTVTSSNPDVGASIATGPFLTINVQYTDPNNAANSFTGPLTFQLFQDLTPTTTGTIAAIANSGFYNGKTFHRVAPNFPNPTDYVIQGGAPNPDGSGYPSGQPGTPFATEPVQQLAFTGPYQLAMANTGVPNSNDTQFFITTAAPNFLSYNYTVFGQLVAGQDLVTRMAQVPTKANPLLSNEKSLPVNPLTMSTVTTSTANPNGVLLLDTTGARPGETATITVTATDTVDHSTASQTFSVTVGPYTGPQDPSINLRPLAAPVTAAVGVNAPRTVTLAGQQGFPDPTHPATLTYSLVTQPAHGTISQFNAATGTFVYNPNPGYHGTDTFQYKVQSSGPRSSPALLSSNPAAVTLNVRNLTTGDFDGDGRADFGYYTPATGTYVLVPSGGGKPTILNGFGGPGWQATAGDYDGDGKADIGLFNAATGTWVIVPSAGGSPIVLKGFGTAGAEPLSGDYDGDGKTDFGYYNPSTATFVVVPSGGGKPTILNGFGGPGWQATSGDYDGDGKADIGLYNAASGTFVVLPSGGGNPLIVQNFGTTGAEPLSGDYDGDHKTDFGYYNPSGGVFVVAPSGGGKPTILNGFGTLGDQATAGDYDGDGKVDVGVYGNGAFVVIPSGGGQPLVITNFGAAGSQPLGVVQPIGLSGERALSLRAASLTAPGGSSPFNFAGQAQALAAPSAPVGPVRSRPAVASTLKTSGIAFDHA